MKERPLSGRAAATGWLAGGANRSTDRDRETDEAGSRRKTTIDDCLCQRG